jgi:hypothetical protein
MNLGFNCKVASATDSLRPARAASSLRLVERRSAANRRPSTMVRTERLRALIGELSIRNMDWPEMSCFLACSQSAVRNYIRELEQAKVVFALRLLDSPDNRGSKKYRVNDDASLVERYMDGLSNAENLHLTPTKVRVRGRTSLADARYFHVLLGGECLNLAGGRDQIRRDPLVAALFGATNMRSDCGI